MKVTPPDQRCHLRLQDRRNRLPLNQVGPLPGQGHRPAGPGQKDGEGIAEGA